MRGSEVIAVTVRLAWALHGPQGTGWGDAELEVPNGSWHNVLTGERWTGGSVKLAELLARFPVALLTRTVDGGEEASS